MTEPSIEAPPLPAWPFAAMRDLDTKLAAANAKLADVEAERAALEAAYDQLHDAIVRVCNAASGEGNHINGVSVVAVPRVIAALRVERFRVALDRSELTS